jgi:putative ATP-dependent endonuclease of the OLD family
VRITSLRIENFRSIKSIDIELGENTVFIGPNNAGKTAILDALRIALTRRWGQRGTGFTEYDVHLAKEGDDPKQSPAIAIELRAEESKSGDWPAGVQQDLDQIVQTDPVTGKNSITLKASCEWSEPDGSFQPAWAFLNAARQPLIAGSARRLNLERFWQYIPVFYLGPLRDAEDEFTPKSQFWGPLLKAMQIPPKLESRVQKVLDLLNAKLLRADPRLSNIAKTLSGATRVAARDRDGAIDLRVVPLKSWDLLSKAQVILRNEPGLPWLPLQRQGQGIQSLSVIFLFQAFVEHLIKELYEAESTPVLALEEPETHLHPQAARALWAHVRGLPGQKIMTTHSPYFVQHVPFRDLRLVHLTESGTEVRWLPATFGATVPHVTTLEPVVMASAGLLTYDRAAQTLTVTGILDETTYRKLLTCYGGHADRAAIEGVLRDLRDRALLFMPDDELRALETFAHRIRGEIFFARRWMIVEGQAEYVIVHALGRALGYDLDEHGVSIIDAMNNGYPATFASLARALGIPWIAVLDGDRAGLDYVRAIADRGFSDAFVQDRCKTHAGGTLEQQLLADGLEAELRATLARVGGSPVTSDRPALEKALCDNKTRYAAELASRIIADSVLAGRMPQELRDAILRLRTLS